jgi:hypothetical protein
MATNLTGSTIASTYSQLLHVDGGPAAGEKIIYSGTGTATALKVGTGSASVDNLQLDGNTIVSTNTNGDINLTPNGTGTVVVSKADIQSGTITTNNATITGGAISNVTFTGTFSGITSIESDTFTTSNVTTGVTLTNNTLSADGTDTNIDINITPKGTGEVNISKVDIDDGAIDGTTIGANAVATIKGSTVLATQASGYATGAGGTVTQLTSRTTGVTLNQACGEITLVAGTLAGHEADEFGLTNSEIAASDVVIVNIKSGAAAGTRKYYTVAVTSVSAGSCTISIGNNDNGSLPAAGTDTLVLSFAVIKGVTS